MRLLITGAAGYIGRNMVKAALARGVAVTALARQAPIGNDGAESGIRWVRYELGADLPDDVFADVSAIIHLANADGSDAEARNIAGTEALLGQARRHDIARFVFVSSQSARAGAPSAYGRAKWRIEQLLHAPREIAVRPGLVYGGEEAALYGSMCKLVRLSPILPNVTLAPAVQPVHVDDLCGALFDIASGRMAGEKPICIGAADPVGFTDFLRLLAWERFGRRIYFLPVPVPMIAPLVRLADRLSFVPAPLIERAKGLLELRPMSISPSLAAAGMVLRPVASGLANEGPARRRGLVREAHTFHRYIIGAKPTIGLTRRYVRAIERHGNGRPLPLPAGVYRFPMVLRVLEPVGFGLPTSPLYAALRRRLDLAAALVEATPAGAKQFRDFESRAAVSILASLGVALTVETILLPLRTLVTSVAAFTTPAIWRKALADA